MKVPYRILKIQGGETLRQEILQKQDEFLDLYSLYLATHCQAVRDDLRIKAYELRILDPTFRFAA